MGRVVRRLLSGSCSLMGGERSMRIIYRESKRHEEE